MKVRPARPADLLALYDICLRTGDSGRDASALYRDPMLLGHVYAGPYATLRPQFAFVLTGADDLPGGYILGVPDSLTFWQEQEARWWPLLRGLYPLTSEADTSPDARLRRMIHRPRPLPDAALLRDFPAHLHIDLLPHVQGGGHGRALMETLLAALRAAGAPGVHLGVGRRNARALGFYRHLGFTVLAEGEAAITMVCDLSAGEGP